MSDTRAVCVECNERFYCEKNQVYVKYGDGGVQAGDLYECPNCHRQIITGLSEPRSFYEHPGQKTYIDSCRDKAIAGD